jgi:hypothetical protein
LYDKTINILFSDIEKIGNTTAFSYKELRKATSDFAYKIGEGGFGSVYKVMPKILLVSCKEYYITYIDSTLLSVV